ncbi:efflux RND transporter permease subunit [Aliikangiella sp. IMCC44359]|uniref:efflux RND transporter permease subunit n=1 Tax=Aliikangiella sp. IMCC44359 TaxID=3459125 RepID=UPI00403AA2DE
MIQYAKLICKFRFVVLSLVLIGSVLAAIGATQITIRNNDDAELPKDDPIVVTNEKLSQVFGEKDQILVSIKTKHLYKNETLQKIRYITQEIKSVQSIIQSEVKSITNIQNIQSSDFGLDVKKLVEQLPLSDSALLQLRSDIEDNPLIYGRAVSHDHQSTVIAAKIAKGFDQATVFYGVRKIVDKYFDENEYSIVGDPVISEAIDAGIQSDAIFLVPLALILQLFGFYYSFKSLKGVLVPFSLIIVSILWTVGIMGFAKLPLTVVSTSIPILLAVIASSYGIHVLHAYNHVTNLKNSATDNLVLAFEKVGRAVLITGFTSALGAGTLAVFKVTSIKEFGIIAAIGISVTTLLSMTLLPVLLTLTRSKHTPTHPKNTHQIISNVLNRITEFSLKNNQIVIVVALLIIMTSIYGITKIRPGADFIEYFPKSHEIRGSIEQFNDDYGGARFFNVMIKAENPDDLKKPEFLQKIWAFQKFAESFDEIGQTYSFVDVIRRIDQVVDIDHDTKSHIPNTQEHVAQYLLLYSISSSPADFNDLVDYDYQHAKINIRVTTSEQEDHLMLYNQLNEFLNQEFKDKATFEFGGMLMLWLAQMKYIVSGEILNIFISVSIVLLFCMFVFRSFKYGILSVLPLVFSTTVTFGLMGFIGIRLEVGTAIITAMIVGIGVDFAVHYLSQFKKHFERTFDINESNHRTIQVTGKAISFDIFSNILGFSVFALSGFSPIQNFGLLITLTMLTTGMSTFILLPAVTNTLFRRHAKSSIEKNQSGFDFDDYNTSALDAKKSIANHENV